MIDFVTHCMAMVEMSTLNIVIFHATQIDGHNEFRERIKMMKMEIRQQNGK